MSTHDDGRARSDSQLEMLVLECLDRWEVEGEAAVDALCERDPAHASRLRARIAVLRDSGLLAASRESEYPEHLGDFRLLQRLGGGGMGVVYLAEQLSLGRRIALKLVRSDQLYFAGTRERFRREVEAAAALDHPAIVRIHSVGEEKGLPFFAMEFLEGATLTDVVAHVAGRSASRLTGADLRAAVLASSSSAVPASERDELGLFAGSWTEAALSICAAIASALEHAHARGVLHRDVKPSNVMLTRDGRAVLLDFGLAARAGSTKLTRTGSQLGSLAYMAPEQIEGRPADVGPRTDVYGLGVTAYELFALAPAYAQGSTTDVSRRIVRGPQPRLRARDPKLSRDLETVCAKAMDPDAGRRYASAADLRADLENLRAGRPIAARTPSSFERASRFVRRHPAATTSIALGALIVIGGPIALAVQQSKARARVEIEKSRVVEANTKLEDALREAHEERARAERNFERALEAVGVLTEVGRAGLVDVPQAEEVRRTLLERALQFHEELLDERRDDPRVALEVTRTKVLVGELLAALGRWDEGDAVLRDALDDLDVAPAGADSDDVAELTARVAKQLGTSLGTRGDPKGAVTVVERGLERLRAEAASERVSIAVRAALATSLVDLAEYRRRAGDAEGAKAAWNEAGGTFATLAELQPDEPRWAAEVGHAYVEFATMRRGFSLPTEKSPLDDDFQRAADILERAIPALERAVEAEPRSVERRVRLAAARIDHATALTSLRQAEQGLAEARRAVEISRALAADHPRTLEHSSRLVRALHVLGITLRNAKRYDEALENDGEVLAVREREVAHHPDRPQLLAGLAIIEQNVGLTHERRGDFAQAARFFERAVGHYEEFLERQPDDQDMRELRNHARTLLGLERARLDEPEAALAAVEGMVEPIAARHVHFRAMVFARLARRGAAAGLDAARVEAWRARALDDLELGYARGSRDVAVVENEEFAALREDPRFVAVAQRARAGFR